MAFEDTVRAAVTTAFNSVGGLKQTATMVNKTASYSFGNSSVSTTDTNKTVDVILLDEKKEADGNRALYTAYFKTEQVDDIAVYDSIVIDSVSYSMHSYNDNGFLIDAVLVAAPGGIDYND